MTQYVMFATDDTSIAEMPIEAESMARAEHCAKVWLDRYEHDFRRAVVIAGSVAPQLREHAVPQIVNFVYACPEDWQLV